MGTAHFTRTILRFLVFGAVGNLLSTEQALAWNIETPTVTPDSLVVGVATPVTVTALIADPAVVGHRVILQSVDASGHLLAMLGDLHDNGEQGDAVAGDHRYTIQTTLTEATATTLYLRVAARFTGSRHRRFSSVITVPVLGSPASSSLYLGQRIAVGASPYSVAVVDVNRDGRLDVVTANAGSADVSVLLGAGEGAFQAQQRFGVGSSPSSVAVADVNGDGQLDVVTGNYYSADVSVLLGNGDGTFQAQQRFGVGSGTLSVAVGDVNGDGRLDVVTANHVSAEEYSSSDVSVLLGNGDGTFQAQQRIVVGGSPSSVAVADVNGDGRLDVVMGNGYGSNYVSVLLGNGDGTF